MPRPRDLRSDPVRTVPTKERPWATVYTDAQIMRSLNRLVDAGIDIDALPLTMTIDEVVRMADETKRPI